MKWRLPKRPAWMTRPEWMKTQLLKEIGEAMLTFDNLRKVRTLVRLLTNAAAVNLSGRFS